MFSVRGTIDRDKKLHACGFRDKAVLGGKGYFASVSSWSGVPVNSRQTCVRFFESSPDRFPSAQRVAMCCNVLLDAAKSPKTSTFVHLLVTGTLPKIVVDRFHAQKNLNDALTKARRSATASPRRGACATQGLALVAGAESRRPHNGATYSIGNCVYRLRGTQDWRSYVLRRHPTPRPASITPNPSFVSRSRRN